MDTAITTVYTVLGMTCGHCLRAVTEAVHAVPGVQDVQVDLINQLVTVTSAVPLDDDAVPAAVADAGYELSR